MQYIHQQRGRKEKMDTNKHYERQERISNLSDILVEESIKNGEAFSEELCYVMWNRAAKVVDALEAV